MADCARIQYACDCNCHRTGNADTYLSSAISGQYQLGFMSTGLIIAGLAAGVALVVIAIGIFMLTVQEPRVVSIESIGSSRRLVRASILMSVGLVSLAIALEWVFGVSIPRLVHAAIIVGLVAALSMTMVALLRVLESLAARTPHRLLVWRTRKTAQFFLWVPLLAVILELIPIVVGAQRGLQPQWSYLWIATCAGSFLTLGIIVQLALMTSLMNTHLRLLRICQRRAGRLHG
jgi:hypothetical protein